MSLSVAVSRLRATDEVVGLASDLIRIDTTNTGDESTVVGERTAAEYVAAKLTDVGYDITYLEASPRRANVVVRLPGADPTRGALVVHAHLDVVPAEASEWRVHPLSGEVSDGYLWGRGAIDMKHMVAMTLALARQYRRDGVVPERDLIFAFVADEENGGHHGAGWLVRRHRELFDGASEAIGEVGGFPVTLAGGARAYLVQTGEKGATWLRLRARGTAGHGSLTNPDNAIARLAEAVGRLDRHRFPLVLTDAVRELLSGLEISVTDPATVDDAVAGLGGTLARLVGSALRDTAAFTMFTAGYKANVVPSTAHATVDGRFLPGRDEAFHRELLEVLGPDVEAEWDSLPAIQADFSGPVVDAIVAAVGQADPGARVLPYLLPAATDAKSWHPLGIRHFGFTPLRLPSDLDFLSLFHGVDERVPVAALVFGTEVLDRILRTC